MSYIRNDRPTVYVHKIAENMIFEGKLMTIVRYKFSKYDNPKKRGTWIVLGDDDKNWATIGKSNFFFRNWEKLPTGEYRRKTLTSF